MQLPGKETHKGFKYIFGAFVGGTAVLSLAIFLTLVIWQATGGKPPSESILSIDFFDNASQIASFIQPVATRGLLEESYDTGFRSTTNGFNFQNYGSRFPQGNLRVQEVRELFGDEVCASVEADDTCIPKPATQLWIDQMNDVMAGGHCVGFTVFSDSLFDGVYDPQQFTPDAAYTVDIEQSPHVMRRISQSWVLQVTDEIIEATVTGTPQDIIDHLLRLQQPVDLGIFSREGGGHSMLTYGVDYKGEGIYHILVYDNNWPGQELYVEVDYFANRWRYDLAGESPNSGSEIWDGDANTFSLLYVPLEAYKQTVSCPFCNSEETASTQRRVLARQQAPRPDYTVVSTTGHEVQVQLTDEEGRRVGFFDGEYINEVPGARLIRLRGAAYNNNEPLIYLPNATDFDVQVQPRAGEKGSRTELRIVGGGMSLAIDNLELEPGEQDAIAVSTEGQSVNYAPNGRRQPTIKLSLEQDDATYMFTLGGADMGAGQAFDLGINADSGQLEIGTEGNNDASFSLMMARIDDEGTDIFANDNVAIGNGAGLDFAAWDGEGAIDFAVDSDGDGTPDAAQPLEDQPVSTVLDDLGSSEEVVTLMGEMAPYMSTEDVDSFTDTLVDLGFDGDDVGEVLFEFSEFGLGNEEMAELITELDLPVEQLGRLVIDLHLDEEAQDGLVEALDLPPDERAALEDEFEKLDAIEEVLVAWEFANQEDEEFGAFLDENLDEILDESGIDADELGYLMDEANLDTDEIAEAVEDLELSDDEVEEALDDTDYSEDEVQEDVENNGTEQDAEPTATATAEGATPTATATAASSATPTAVLPSATPSVIPPTATATSPPPSATPTADNEPEPTATPSPSATAKPSATPSASPTASLTPTATSTTATATSSATPTATNTSVPPTATFTATPTATAAATVTATSTATATATPSPTPTATATAVLLPEIDVQGNGTTITAGDTSPTAADGTDFGGSFVGVPISTTFTIENVGNADLLLTGTPLVRISGANAADFAVIANPTETISPTTTTSFTISFLPSIEGMQTATVSIANNDNDENPYDFAIQGTGVLLPVPEIEVQGKGQAISSGSATPIVANGTDFGVTPLGTPLSQTFTIANVGTSLLSLTGNPLVALSGTDAVDFSITTLPTAAIDPSGTTTFDVVFNPATSGIKTAVLSIANDDTDENPYTFTILATATTAEIDVLGNGQSIVDGTTTASLANGTDFATSFIGTPVVHSFTIANLGDLNLNLTGSPLVSVSGANVADFVVTMQPNNLLAPSETTSFEITFTPSVLGIHEATVSIANDDLDENPYDFVIQGTGANIPVPEIDVQGNGQSIADGDTTPDVADHTDFGAALLGGTPIVRTYTIANGGTGWLNLTNIPDLVTISGANAADFAVTLLPTTPISITEITTFAITFTPSAAGLHEATISIGNDDADENPYDFAIQAAALAPEMDLQGNGQSILDGDTTPDVTDDTDFGAGILGAPIIKTFTVENLGGSPLNLTGSPEVVIGGADAADFVITAVPATIIAANNGTTTFEITFTPSELGVRTATVSIANNDLDENPYDFVIQGMGQAPEMDVQGNGLSIADGDATPDVVDDTDFGSITIGSTIVKTYTIENLGAAALNLTGSPAVSVGGTDAADFSVTAAPTTPIAAGTTTTFAVTFSPTTTGAKTAVISLANDDSDENPYTFTISGSSLDVEIDVQGNGQSIVSGDVTPSTADATNFGSSPVAVGVTHSFVIENQGNLTLNLTGSPLVAVMGSGAADFVVTAVPAANIAAAGSTSFDITFTPSTAGIRSATVSIANNDSDENSYTFAIQGEGLSPSTSLTVDTTTDSNDAAYQVCSDVIPNDCSLRGAISKANADTVSTYTISVPANTYTLSLAGAGEDSNTTGDLDVLGNVVINGAGAGSTIVDGNSSDRVFHILGGATATINALTVQHGNLSSGVGAGLYNQGGLTLTNAAVDTNAGSQRGGGVGTVGGTLDISNSIISNNSCTVVGGAVSTQSGATVTITDSALNDNFCTHGGGGLNIEGSNTVTVENSTINNNTVTRQGSAVWNAGGALTIRGSLLTGNSGDPAINSWGGGASTIVENSTISGNNNGGVRTGHGSVSITLNHATVANNGGIGAWNASGTIAANSSIIASNTSSDCSGTISSGGYNLASDATCSFGGTGDVNSSDPMLGALQNNGGSTSTHAFSAASAAIDAIPSGTNGCGSTYTTDQIGQGRPFGASCDMGAYEAQSVFPVPEIDVQGNSTSIVNGDTTPSTADATDFGTIGVGSSLVATFTIENTGMDDLTLNGSPLVAVSGTNASEFVVTTAPTSPVAASNSTAFQVTFTPTAAGIRTATISIANNDTNENPYTFAIQGNGSVPDFSLDVDTTTDSNDAAFQVCDDALANDCSLRGAISKANADTANAYTISLPAGTYTLAGTGDNVNATGDLDVTHDLTITGAGTGSTIIDGNGGDRVLHVSGTTSSFVLSNLTIQNGSGTGGGINITAVSVAPSINLSDIVLRNNSGGSGGGIYYNPNQIGSSMTLNRVEVSGNSVTHYGGGVYVRGSGVSITNSTLSGNSAGNMGGGLYLRNTGCCAGNATLTHVTIANNSAGSGGGLYKQGGSFNIQNSLIANNTGSDCGGVLTSQDYNLIEDVSGCTISGTTTNNITGVDPNLGSLSGNGGSGQTHALQAGSPALDAIPSGTNGCGSTYSSDQRGEGRPFNAGSGNSCDVGAYEAQTVLAAPEIDVQGNSTSIANGDVTPSTADDTDFGTVNVGANLVTTFTIENTGTADLTLSGSPLVGVSGTNASEFVVTTAPTSPVAASGSTTFQVTFTPTAGGVRSATISIANTDSDENPYTFAIQGTGAVVSTVSLTVDTTSDDGALQTCDDAVANDCSLRGAITAANSDPNTTTISFNIGGGGAQTIVLGSILPAVTEATIIDGSTQPGYGGTTLITVDANNTSGIIFDLEASNITLQDFTVANAPGEAIRATDAPNLLISNMDLSASGDYGLRVLGNTTTLTVQNSTLTNRVYGIHIVGGVSATITNNDLSNATGWALTVKTLTGSLAASGNTFSGSANGAFLDTLDGLLISDGSVGGTDVALAGLGSVSGEALRLRHMTNTTVDNVDLSYTGGGGSGYGLRVIGNTSTVTIQNSSFIDRVYGIHMAYGVSATITNNDLSNATGWALTVQFLTGSGSLTASGNTFTGSTNGVLLESLDGLLISDGTVGGTHVALAGLGSVSGEALRLRHMTNTTVDNVDLSYTGGGSSGYGLRVIGNTSTVTIQNSSFTDRVYGIHMAYGVSATITNNDLSNATGWALTVQFLTGSLTASGNTFTGSTNGVLLETMDGLLISDGSVGGTDVALTGMGSVSGEALRLRNMTNTTVDSVNLSYTGGGSSGYGIRILAGSATLTIQNATLNNRAYGLNATGGTPLNVNCTVFQNNIAGIELSIGATLTNNSLSGNGVGVVNGNGGVTVTAENNYWGAIDGPSNLGGAGDSYSGTVDADPFLTSAPGCASILSQPTEVAEKRKPLPGDPGLIVPEDGFPQPQLLPKPNEPKPAPVVTRPPVGKLTPVPVQTAVPIQTIIAKPPASSEATPTPTPVSTATPAPTMFATVAATAATAVAEPLPTTNPEPKPAPVVAPGERVLVDTSTGKPLGATDAAPKAKQTIILPHDSQLGRVWLLLWQQTAAKQATYCEVGLFQGSTQLLASTVEIDSGQPDWYKLKGNNQTLFANVAYRLQASCDAEIVWLYGQDRLPTDSDVAPYDYMLRLDGNVLPTPTAVPPTATATAVPPVEVESVASPTPSPAATAEPSPIPEASPTVAPTATPEAISTVAPLPTAEPSPTPAPPTATAIPPTATAISPTATPEPTATEPPPEPTALPEPTAVAPTATPPPDDSNSSTTIVSYAGSWKTAVMNIWEWLFG
ncbi:MAG: choice-of-anchor D domain-containing protein [Chloroflexota bacterium]